MENQILQFGHVTNKILNNLCVLSLYYKIAQVPYDGVADIEIVSVPIPVSVVFSLLAGAGMIFGIICIVFVIVNRKSK